jgi:glycosyltransferase involved in cell wall biosynthesis
MKISLISTVYNEASSIDRLLESLNRQTRQPDEIVLVDGGSTDDTPGKIIIFAKNHPHLNLKLLVKPGYNISQGRNAAIAAASHPLIAATDAGVRLPDDWLELLTAPFFSPASLGDPLTSQNFVNIIQNAKDPNFATTKQNLLASQKFGKVQVVSGFFRTDPNPESAFEVAMGATVIPVEEDIVPEKFLPSSRSVAFTKEAWQAVGGYPEWLDYCEDLIFDLNLRKLGYLFYWQPKAVVWFKPRTSLGAFYSQYYRYARGDGKANLFLKRHILRYFIYLVFAPLAVSLVARYRWLSLPLFICAEGYVIKAHRRLFKNLPEFKQLPPAKKMLALLYVPLIRAVGDIAKMIGYPVGVWWRLRRRKTN